MIVLSLAVLSGVFQFLSPKVYDPDGFYHIRHAWMYRTGGFFETNFPWVQYSVISKYQADIWYGFHLLLVPLTFFDDPVLGIKFGSFVLTTLVLFSFYVLLKKLGIKWPLAAVVLFFFFIPDTNFRFLVLRPHLISFILSLAVFYFAVKKNIFGIAAAAAGLTFVHLALGWLPLAVVLAVLVCAFVHSHKFELKPLLAVLGGIGVGLIARPNFLGALKIAYVQIVELMLAKSKSIPLRLGAELKPAGNLSLFTHEILPLLLIVVPIVILLIRVVRKKVFNTADENNRTAVTASLFISLVFGFLTVVVARRAIDLWVGFSFVFAGLVLSLFYNNYAWLPKRLSGWKIAGGVILGLLLLVNTLYYSLFKYPRQAPDHRNIKPAAEWLRDNSQQGEIVFHSYWDNFPILFFYDQKNYYINGMDPIFLNALDPALNIKLYFFTIDKLLMVGDEAYTCGANPCAPGAVISAYGAIKADFKAKYVFVEPLRTPRFYQYLKNDDRFRETFSSQAASVFEVL